MNPNSLKFTIHGFFLIFISSFSLIDAQSNTNDSTPDAYAYARFTPSMAIIIVVLIAALFIMGFFSIYLRHCTDVRSGASVRGGQGNPRIRSRRIQRGLDPAVIETFPMLIYSVVRGLKIGKGALECAVCLNEFEDDETLRLIPKCDHVFHPECIDEWLGSHTTCPVCRANLIPQPGETVQIPDFSNVSDTGNDSSDIEDIGEASLRIHEDMEEDTKDPEVINPSTSVKNRPPRARSVRARFFGKFPRSHSTGHSVIQPGDNCERFTLRLPEEIRRQIVNGKLHRTTSCVVLPREGSSRRPYRSGVPDEGSSRGRSYRRLEKLEKLDRNDKLDRTSKSERWPVFSFFSRASSTRSPRGLVSSSAEVPLTPKGSSMVRLPSIDCLGSSRATKDHDHDGESSTEVAFAKV